jgi:peptide/nickel transport system permease protein
MMPFQPVLFVTDLLIGVLLAALGGFAWYASRHEHLRAPWRQVGRRPLAMSALVLLAVYALIGVLDSLHYRARVEQGGAGIYSTQVHSLLDVATETLRAHTEKTYSAPFAVQAFSKETVARPDGSAAREYPRLKYGGAHLDDPARRTGDVIRRVGIASLAGFAIWAGVVGIIVTGLRRETGDFGATWRRLRCGETAAPWRTILGTLGAVILLGANAAYLSQYYHVFGTDQVGQDVLYRTLKSVRTGLVIGTVTTLVMLPFALLLGIAAGYLRGRVDDVVQYVYTTLSSIPGVLLIAAAILSLQVYVATHADAFDNVAARADLRLLFLCLILGVTSWTGLCRLLRGEALKLREADYVLAAQALGAGRLSIMARHLLPNVMHIVLISVVLDFSGLVLAEAVLSYVGVGVDPTMDSWGNMINSARLEMAREPMVWWSLAAAFTFMFALVLAANLFADAVRDAFDPRLRR